MMFPRQHMAWGNRREYSRCKGIASQLPQQCHPACKRQMFRGTESSWLGSRRLEFQSGIIVPMFHTFASPPQSAEEKGTCWKQCMGQSDVAPEHTQVWDDCQGAFGRLPGWRRCFGISPLLYTSSANTSILSLSAQTIRKLFSWPDRFPGNDPHFLKKKKNCKFIPKKNMFIVEKPEHPVT